MPLYTITTNISNSEPNEIKSDIFPLMQSDFSHSAFLIKWS